MTPRPRRDQDGFTLMELVVAMGILAGFLVMLVQLLKSLTFSVVGFYRPAMHLSPFVEADLCWLRTRIHETPRKQLWVDTSACPPIGSRHADRLARSER